MMGLIESQEMLGFINGDISTPAQHINASNNEPQKENPDYLTWKRSDRLLRGWITFLLVMIL